MKIFRWLVELRCRLCASPPAIYTWLSFDGYLGASTTILFSGTFPFAHCQSHHTQLGFSLYVTKILSFSLIDHLANEIGWFVALIDVEASWRAMVWSGLLELHKLQGH